jgi:drug/metabolite transporter (DMT)-like permease
MSAPAADIPHMKPPSWAVALAFALLFLCWGTTYRATGIAMKQEQMPPALYGGVRLCIAGTILLLYQLGRGQSLRLTGGEFMRLLLISWFLFLGANFLINKGQRDVDSGVAAILIATTPLWMGLFAMSWPFREHLSWRGWLGLLIGFAGVVLTMLPQLNHGALDRDTLPYLLILASAAAWAMGSLVSRNMAVKLPHLTSAGYQMLFGGISQVTLGTCLGEWPDFIDHMGLTAVVAFVYLLIAGSLCGFVAFNWLLGHVSLAKVGTYAYVNPVIAVLIGSCFGEPVHAWLFAGIAVILAGVYLVRGDHAPSKEIELEPD